MTQHDDRIAIMEVKARYCRCLDTKAWTEYGNCFTDDYVLTLPGERSFGPKAKALEFISTSMQDSVSAHHVHNCEISFDGPDAADVIWAMQDRNIWSDRRAAQMGCRSQTGYGHYRERYVRCDDGAWRIQRCELSYLHTDRQV